MEPIKEEKSLLQQTMTEITQPFKDLLKTSRALTGLNLSYLLEGLNYFGILTLLAMFFNTYVQLTDQQAGPMVGFQTGGITICMLILGATVDFIGVRKALLASLVFMLVGRVVLTMAPVLGGTAGMWSSTHLIAMLGIVGVMLGYGIYQPAAYTACRKFTTPETSAMGYAMLYALMNLGGFLPGLISPPIRAKFGITGVFWAYNILTFLGILVVIFVINKKAVNDALTATGQSEIDINKKKEDKKPLGTRMYDYMRRFPITDFRFMFFIFILIPVQTLFAHNWLTLPQYCSRAFTGVVKDNFEFFVNLNPIFIFVLTPMVAALTSKKNTYRMMIYGTSVMALAPFLLVFGPNVVTLFAYIILLTIGEAMWQPRFLQWVAEIAPKDMTGIYMGLGQFPWFLTKVLTSFYSGWFLAHYCPQGMLPSSMNTEFMWLIYACIAVISPIGLIFAQKWMMKDTRNMY